MNNKYYLAIQKAKDWVQQDPLHLVEQVGAASCGYQSAVASRRIFNWLNAGLTIVSRNCRADAVALAAVLLSGAYTADGSFLMPATRDVIRNIPYVKRWCRKGFRFNKNSIYTYAREGK